jgi:hypothetical protein
MYDDGNITQILVNSDKKKFPKIVKICKVLIDGDKC